MKKLKMIIVVVVMLVTPTLSMASVDFGDHQNQNQNQNQNQKQTQIQGQTQSVNNKVSSSINNKVGIGVGISNNAGQNIAITEERDRVDLPVITPIYLAPVPSGRLGDYTNSLPKFANKALVPLQENDVVIEILDVHFGFFFNRITFEEVEQMLLEKAKLYDASKGDIRYKVRFQDSGIAGGIGGGGAVGTDSNSGGTGNTMAILPGVAKSTYNPIFHITFYRIEKK